jgi:hypothetical protein
MSLIHVCPIQIEVPGRSFAGQMVPPIGEQDPADIQKQRGKSATLVSLNLRQPRTLRLLWFQHVALVDPATSKEAVAYHVLAKQKNDHYQQD